MDLEVSEVSLLPSVTRVTGGASEERPPSAWFRLLQEAASCDDPVRFQALARQAQRLEREIGAAPGKFFFCRLSYGDETDFPRWVELGTLRGNELIVERFRNRFD